MDRRTFSWGRTLLQRPGLSIDGRPGAIYRFAEVLVCAQIIFKLNRLDRFIIK